MRTFFRLKQQTTNCHPEPRAKDLLFARIIVVLLGAMALAAPAQVLARPGWAGSGVTAEPWYRHAVFYRIRPALFQDSTGNGAGDLRGITQRLDYLTSLGVDALVLVPPFSENDFGDLARAASGAHLRLVIQLNSASTAEARKWLNQGAAGLFLDGHNLAQQPTPAQLAALRGLTNSFPGERILLTSGLAAAGAAQYAQLSVAEDFTAARPDAGVLRRQLASNLAPVSAQTSPLLELSGLSRTGSVAPAQAAILDRALALMLFASRAAVLFDAGRELGLRSFDGNEVAMQWTPSNLTAQPSEAVAPKPAPKPQQEVYGTYTPYVPGMKLPSQPASKPAEPEAAEPVDPNSLRGFTTGTLPAAIAANGTLSNAALEDQEPNSLLNFYRHLIALHHGNPALRNGTETVFDRDAEGSLVWLRRAPAGTRTASSILIVCNLSEQPADLALAPDLAAEHLSVASTLRPLLTASAAPLMTAAENALPTETAEHLILPAYTLFVGEFTHEGAIANEPGPRVRHRRR